MAQALQLGFEDLASLGKGFGGIATGDAELSLQLLQLLVAEVPLLFGIGGGVAAPRADAQANAWADGQLLGAAELHLLAGHQRLAAERHRLVGFKHHQMGGHGLAARLGLGEALLALAQGPHLLTANRRKGSEFGLPLFGLLLQLAELILVGLKLLGFPVQVVEGEEVLGQLLPFLVAAGLGLK